MEGYLALDLNSSGRSSGPINSLPRQETSIHEWTIPWPDLWLFKFLSVPFQDCRPTVIDSMTLRMITQQIERNHGGFPKGCLVEPVVMAAKVELRLEGFQKFSFGPSVPMLGNARRCDWPIVRLQNLGCFPEDTKGLDLRFLEVAESLQAHPLISARLHQSTPTRFVMESILGGVEEIEVLRVKDSTQACDIQPLNGVIQKACIRI